jgi:hypothetical protein
LSYTRKIKLKRLGLAIARARYSLKTTVKVVLPEINLRRSSPLSYTRKIKLKRLGLAIARARYSLKTTVKVVLPEINLRRSSPLSYTRTKSKTSAPF